MDEKKKLWRHISNVSEYDLEGSIDNAIAVLQKLKNDNTDKVLRLEVVPNHYEEGNHIELQYEAIETDEEFKERMEKEANQKMLEEKWEREEYEKLKAKYEKTD